MIKKGACLAYFLIIDLLTLLDLVETSTVSNLIRIATSVGVGKDFASVFNAFLGVFMFVPLLIVISRQKNDIQQLRNYLLTRTKLIGYYKVVFLQNIRSLNLVISLKIGAELIFCSKELFTDFSSVMIILKLNILYYIAGLLIIAFMELLNMIISMQYKQSFALMIVMLFVCQLLSFRNVIFDYLLVPIAQAGVSHFFTFTLVKVAELLIVLFGVWMLARHKGNKGDVL